MKLVDPNQAKEFSATFFGDPILKMAVNVVMDNAPKVEAVEVVYGHWIPLEYDSYADGNPVWDLWECSECQEEHSGDEDTLTPYCPNCGAKMDGFCSEGGNKYA